MAALLTALAGCSTAGDSDQGGRPNDTGAEPDTASVADTATADTTIADAGPEPDTTTPDTADTLEAAPDTNAPEAESGPPPGPVDCFADDFGPSSTTLVDFFYQHQVADCTSSACSDFFKFDPTCVLTLQVSDVEHTATLDAADCAKFTKWLTSDLLVSHLRDSVTCAGKVDGVFESTQLTLGDGPASKKTFMCPDEPFASHRACLGKLRDKYFPGL